MSIVDRNIVDPTQRCRESLDVSVLDDASVDEIFHVQIACPYGCRSNDVQPHSHCLVDNDAKWFEAAR
jgi:hypothetical protein